METGDRAARRVIRTAEFNGWMDGLDPERRAAVAGAVRRAAAGGPTLGRPHVDVIHGTRLHKLKEIRVDRGARVLFAFDSNRDAVMLVGGDKAGKWNRWYPPAVRQAERLYLDHERSIGKEQGCLTRHAATRTSRGRSR
jgi:hypothetical protein